MKAKIIDLSHAVATSFENVELDDITVLAHDIAYSVSEGKQKRTTQYLKGDEIKQFLLDVYLHIGNFAPKQPTASYEIFKAKLSAIL